MAQERSRPAAKLFLWSDECADAFERLRHELSSACVLAFPDFARPFVLATDASRTALGAILSQTSKSKNKFFVFDLGDEHVRISLPGEPKTLPIGCTRWR